MEYIMLLISGTGILVAYRCRNMYEKHFLLKLFGYWLVSIITLTVDGSIPLPVGLAISVLILLNTRANKKAKQYAVISGLAGYLLSVLVFIIRH